MATDKKRLYEGMFLVDSALAAADWNAAIGAVERVLSRAEADVVSLKKWDERKLTYAIKGKVRGTYILTYFKCDPEKLSPMERDVQLSEEIIRALFLKTDKMSDEDINQLTPLEQAEKEEAEAQKAKEEAMAKATAVEEEPAAEGSEGSADTAQTEEKAE
ncbi:30S ribosomal protein S6 [Anaerohalosphaera lusitana]|uniref:Small ribosomal subunit protein bS6 n=1 Tax=Anaerohalosphaera lusitana TaxID=1936003 RepID=A0A1U9NHV3_9BACT|nr:30S ribosomal protein S6 [Anaerohalosphaera lusitana]AQT67328.1 30S ribosomal protein S6 [Anaerohalosphaera lusitana]